MIAYRYLSDPGECKVKKVVFSHLMVRYYNTRRRRAVVGITLRTMFGYVFKRIIIFIRNLNKERKKILKSSKS